MASGNERPSRATKRLKPRQSSNRDQQRSKARGPQTTGTRSQTSPRSRKMTLPMTGLQRTDVHAALLAYWTARDEAAAAQGARGSVDVGQRAGTTGGGHLDRIAQLFGRLARDAGAPPSAIFYNAPVDDPARVHNASNGYTLPGYYRPIKQWDVVVWTPGKTPAVCIELKSQSGPSYGNNANNRAEEAIGNSYDLKRAQNAGLIGGEAWIGYVYIIEEDSESRRIRGSQDRGRLDRDPFFDCWSYLTRVSSLCERLIDDGHYNSAWAVATSRPTCPATPTTPRKCPQIAAGQIPCKHAFDWCEMDEQVSGYVQFIRGFTERIQSHYPPKSGSLPTAITGRL
jgi:hypothetical protein